MIDLSQRERPSARLVPYRVFSCVAPPLAVEGRLTRVVGLTLEAVGCRVPIGGRCRILSDSGEDVEAEVVGFADDTLYLMPIVMAKGLQLGARIVPQKGIAKAPAGMQLLGRVLDGRGIPLDGKGALEVTEHMPLVGPSINPLNREPIRKPLDVGIRTINNLMTVGRGQRIGLFAGSGVGKSVLLGMMAKFTAADITVVGLIGERGREVKEFIEQILGPEGLKRSVVVASPADDSPLMRMHGAMQATAIAEYYRDQGKDVLLLMDSLTRYAQAQREIALAIGEPPATKGYPPSVFAKLPALVERAGNGAAGKGSITAFYTVLTEGDDVQDPIADSARAILDGHIVLSRRIAEEGLYPAIDVEASVSRAMTSIVDEPILLAAQRFKSIYSTYQQNRDLISVGAYARGSDPEIDLAIDMMPKIKQFLRQGIHQQVTLKQGLQELVNILVPEKPNEKAKT